MNCSCAATTSDTPSKSDQPGSLANHFNFARRQRDYLNVTLPERTKLAQLRAINLRENWTINSRDHTQIVLRWTIR